MANANKTRQLANFGARRLRSWTYTYIMLPIFWITPRSAKDFVKKVIHGFRAMPHALTSKLRAASPPIVKRQLKRIMHQKERMLFYAKRYFKIETITLAKLPAAFADNHFKDGPYVLVNNALGWGGAERQVVNTLQGLMKCAIPAGLLCFRLGEGPDYDFYKSALKNFSGFIRNAMTLEEAFATLLGNIPDKTVKRMKKAVAWMPLDVQEDIFRLAAEFAILKPSVVHAWQDRFSITAGYAARFIGVPRIVISGRTLAPLHYGYFHPFMLRGYHELAACPSVIMVNNSEAGAADYANWLGISPQRFTIKRNGINTSIIRRADEQAISDFKMKIGVPRDAPVIGSIFRFYAEKRPFLWVETAVKIAARKPECHFIIFGTGPMLEKTLDAGRKAGLSGRLHCPGTINDAALGLSLFDIFLLTSSLEGTPNVILEASLLGIPVVATEAGGTRETILEGKTGYLIGKPDADLLAGQIISILDDESWKRKARQEGPTFIESRFGLQRMIDETLQIYCQRAM